LSIFRGILTIIAATIKGFLPVSAGIIQAGSERTSLHQSCDRRTVTFGLTAEHAENAETKNIKGVFSAVSALSAVKKPQVCESVVLQAGGVLLVEMP